MSKIGEAVISAIDEANEQGLVTLSTSPDVARKKLHLAQKYFSVSNYTNQETLKK